MYTRESELELMVLHQMSEIKRQYLTWAQPYELARELMITVTNGNIGPHQEGAAFGETIVLDPTVGVKARQRFTLYHEIVHHLIRRNDELYSILHEQYHSDEDFRRIQERLCNVGAAEFVIPRQTALDAIETSGFSIALVKDLSKVDEVSSTAVCVQLALCAQHQCITVVCRMAPHSSEGHPSLFHEEKPRMALQVTTATSSVRTKYVIARGSFVFKGHLFMEAYEAENEKVVCGKDIIPFSNNRSWVVECEATRIGKQLFGMFHIDSPPMKNPYQLELF